MLSAFLIEGISHPVRNMFIVILMSEGLQQVIFYFHPSLMSLKIGIILSNSADPGCG